MSPAPAAACPAIKLDYSRWAELSLAGELLPEAECLAILNSPDIDLLLLAQAAGRVRQHYFGKKVKVHQINNVQNGLCPEDCGYCGQAKSSEAPVMKYPLKSEEDIINEARQAKAQGVFRYCMVSSGRGLNDKRTEDWVRILQRIRSEVGIRTCLSVGFVSFEQAKKLKDAGLDRLNHNLNTSAAHTPKIVSTHTYDDRVQTIMNAQKAGLDNCSGMIVGMGETDQDILSVGLELRRLQIPSIPVNFLVPIEGNRLQNFDQLSPERCLRILCLFRLLNPSAELRMGGGREGHLRSLQALSLWPANSLFVEGYLVSRGDAKSKAYRLIADAGFELDDGGNSANLELFRSMMAAPFAIDEDPDVLNKRTTVPAGARRSFADAAAKAAAVPAKSSCSGGSCNG